MGCAAEMSTSGSTWCCLLRLKASAMLHKEIGSDVRSRAASWYEYRVWPSNDTISLNKQDTVGYLHVFMSCSKLGEWLLSYISRVIIKFTLNFYSEVFWTIWYFCYKKRIHPAMPSTQWLLSAHGQSVRFEMTDFFCSNSKQSRLHFIWQVCAHWHLSAR